MALGYLFILFVVLGGISVIGSLALLLVTKPRTRDILLILMTVYSTLIAYINASAQPSNYVGTQILIWMIAMVADAGVVMRFVTRKQSLISRVMVAASVVLGTIVLMF